VSDIIKPARESWDSYFCAIAEVVATRGSCPRRKVGIVLVNGRNVIATGYNGSLHGTPHCDEAGCVMQDGHCIRAVHAEMNALLQANHAGISTAYSTAYITCNPCLKCFQALYQAGVKRIVYKDDTYGAGDVDYSIFGLNSNQMPDIVHLDRNSSKYPDRIIEER
jgi:dCMP deaminase